MPEANAAPTEPRISDSEFLRMVNRGEAGGFLPVKKDEQRQGAAKRNHDKANEDLGHIEALRQHPSFKWFFDVFIRSGFKVSRRSLEAPDATDADLPKIAARFQVWKAIIESLDRRELACRRLTSPGDPRIAELVKQLE